MAYIHDKGYAHRDLKSANILYNRDTMRAKVADFGMSRLLQDEDSDTVPDDGGLQVPLLQMAPVAEPAEDRLLTAQCGTPQ